MGGTTHAEFLQASGEMTEAEFTTFLADAIRVQRLNVQLGGPMFICMDFPARVLSGGRETESATVGSQRSNFDPQFGDFVEVTNLRIETDMPISREILRTFDTAAIDFVEKLLDRQIVDGIELLLDEGSLAAKP